MSTLLYHPGLGWYKVSGHSLVTHLQRTRLSVALRTYTKKMCSKRGQTTCSNFMNYCMPNSHHNCVGRGRNNKKCNPYFDNE
jgi:hypothetical protein